MREVLESMKVKNTFFKRIKTILSTILISKNKGFIIISTIVFIFSFTMVSYSLELNALTKKYHSFLIQEERWEKRLKLIKESEEILKSKFSDSNEILKWFSETRLNELISKERYSISKNNIYQFKEGKVIMVFKVYIKSAVPETYSLYMYTNGEIKFHNLRYWF